MQNLELGTRSPQCETRISEPETRNPKQEVAVAVVAMLSVSWIAKVAFLCFVINRNLPESDQLWKVVNFSTTHRYFWAGSCIPTASTQGHVVALSIPCAWWTFFAWTVEGIDCLYTTRPQDMRMARRQLHAIPINFRWARCYDREDARDSPFTTPTPSPSRVRFTRVKTRLSRLNGLLEYLAHEKLSPPLGTP